MKLVELKNKKVEERDPKGLYAKARAGAISEFTGVSSPYEPPLSAELQMDGGQQSAESIAERIVGYLYETGRLN
ncbi:adenylyl-sulfate kinase [Pseudomonas sp. sp1636]|uniref:adenylyl-sulfate kinase n=1 Tax=Pseudomonas sp. sp1636 TaxID=3036707 RepID=UPI0025A4E794|nr:adenylyl-sulfate kinase [Pseudomonas sp. sp1636]MDM8348591.1 adenylyl-sulfate kinase [Pseudomonas sp. sp1636]